MGKNPKKNVCGLTETEIAKLQYVGTSLEAILILAIRSFNFRGCVFSIGFKTLNLNVLTFTTIFAANFDHLFFSALLTFKMTLFNFFLNLWSLFKDNEKMFLDLVFIKHTLLLCLGQ